jgi:hypothetical protein
MRRFAEIRESLARWLARLDIFGWKRGSMLFGGGGVSVKPTAIHHMRWQDSQYGVIIPIVYGRARVPGHIIWAGHLQATLHTSSAGKGIFGGGSTSSFYTYAIAHIDCVAIGPITSFGRLWRMGSGGLQRRTLAQVKAFWSLFLGNIGQAPWSYMTSHHAGQALGYTELAYAGTTNDNLGTSASIPQRTWEVFGFLPYSANIKDADPSAVIQDIIKNAFFGMAPGATWVDSAVTFATLTQYAVAMSFLISPVFDQQKAGREWIALLLDVIHAEALWSEGQMRVVPYPVTAVTGNGVTWIPALTPVVPVFTDDDFILDSPTAHELTVKVQDPQLRNNVVKVEYINVLHDYNIDTAEMTDESDVVTLGPRRASVRQFHPIPNGGMAAQVAKFKLQKEMQIARQYTFKAAPTKAALLDPMDVIALTSVFFGLNNYLVRVVSLNETGDPEGGGGSDLAIEVVCEDLMPGFAPGPAGGGGPPAIPCFFDPTVWFSIGADFTPASIGIFRNTDFTATAFTNVDPPDWVPLQNYYQDINMDVDGKTVVAGGNLISYSLDAGATFHATNMNDGAIALFFGGIIGEATGGHGIAFSPQRAVCVGEYDNWPSGSIGAAWWADRSNLAVWTRVQIDNRVSLPFVDDTACFGLAYGNGAFVAGFGGGLQTSLDGGQTWTRTFDNQSNPTLAADETARSSVFDWMVVQFNGSYFLAISDGAGPGSFETCWMATSLDGLTWDVFLASAQPALAFGSGALNALQWDAAHNVWVYASGPFIGTKPGIWTSPDGHNWTRRFTGAHIYTGVPNTFDVYSGLCPVCNEWFTFGQDGPVNEGAVVHATDPTDGWTRRLLTTPPKEAFGQGWGKQAAGIMLLAFPAAGQMAVSTDDGASFHLVPVPPELPNCAFTSWAFAPLFTPGPIVPPATEPPGGSSPPDPSDEPAQVNTPIFLEPHNFDSTVPAHTLWIAVSGQGGDPNWGSAVVFMSDDGGVSFPHELGTANAPAIMGTLLSDLPNTADPDLVDTLSVDLSESGGVVSSLAHAQADAGYNLAMVDSELIAFGDVAAGSGPNQYDLTYLRRGVNGTAIVSHLAGAPFFFLGSLAILDPGVCVVSYPAGDVGVSLFFKFQGSNVTGGGTLDLSTCVPYPYLTIGP